MHTMRKTGAFKHRDLQVCPRFCMNDMDKMNADADELPLGFVSNIQLAKAQQLCAKAQRTHVLAVGLQTSEQCT